MSEKAQVYDMDVTDTINKRIFARTIASDNTDALLSFRPIPTKYVYPDQTINPPCNRSVLPYKTNTNTGGIKVPGANL